MNIERRQKCLITESSFFDGMDADAQMSFERIGDDVLIELIDWQDPRDDSKPWIRVSLESLREATQYMEQSA